MNKTLSDYEALDRNDFWKLYMNKLSEDSKNLALRLKTVGLDGVLKLQGELAGIERALASPNQLIADILKEDNTNHA